MKHIHLDVHIGAVLLLAAGYLYSLAMDMPDGPAMFPKLLLIILMLFAGVILAQGVVVSLRARRDGQPLPRFFPRLGGPMAVFALLVGYVVLIDVLGFFSATTLASALFMALFGLRRAGQIALVALGVDLFIYALFVWQLQIALPTGWLI